MDLKNITIIVSEIDGIITDGMAPTDYLNNTLFKNYCMHDFEAINKLKSYFDFVFLADDPAISYNIMRMRNIPAFFTTNMDDKLSILSKKILPHYRARPENLLYIGNFLSDVPCMHLAQISFAPEGAFGVVQNALYKIPCAAGKGIISYVASVFNTEIAARKCKE